MHVTPQNVAMSAPIAKITILGMWPWNIGQGQALKCLCDLESDLDLDLQVTFKGKRSKIHVTPQNEAMSALIAKITILRRDLDI